MAAHKYPRIEKVIDSPSVHDRFVRLEAVTPEEYREEYGNGLEISWDVFESPLGQMAAASTPRGICFLSFVKSEHLAEKEIRAHWPRARLKKAPAPLRPIAKEINARIFGKRRKPLTIQVKGTVFQIQVWDALLRVPEGKVTSYKKIAEFIGRPTALRAVGTAVGANPVCYLIPCHRAIRSTGEIGDYHWGSQRKAALLKIERSH